MLNPNIQSHPAATATHTAATATTTAARAAHRFAPTAHPHARFAGSASYATHPAFRPPFQPTQAPLSPTFLCFATAKPKVAYPALRIARTVANARQLSHHHNSGSLRIYSCPRCGAWHLTHKPALLNMEPDHEPMSARECRRLAKTHRAQLKALRHPIKF